MRPTNPVQTLKARWQMGQRVGALAAVFQLALTSGGFGATPGFVEAAVKPGERWTRHPVRLVADLPAALVSHVDTNLSQYGGLRARRQPATGFFYPAKISDRWWLVDPEGCLFLHKGVTSVRTLTTTGGTAALKQKFGSQENWAEATTTLLREFDFNGLGAWSDTAALRAVAAPLVYTRIWNFMSAYGKKRGGTFAKPGHTGYPGDCIFVFDPEFEKFCDEHARALAAQKDDPWLLGHFSDNEMPLKLEALRNYLGLPAADAGHQAALAWLQQRHGAGAGAADITPRDESDFLGVVVARYFRIVSAAIKKHDPHHLFLGARFHGADLRRPEIFRAAGPYLDVVSVNYYNAWSPDLDRLAMWEREAQKPVLITEWYVKAVDSGLPNLGGAGWLVKTQGDRGRFYENFTLRLLESKACVGWHWFKYIDNDPADPQADPSNRDSNKGILNNRYEPYQPLLASMKRINERAAALIDYFDGRPPAAAPVRPPGEKSE